MNWDDVADFCGERRCVEKRRYNRCGCRGKKLKSRIEPSACEHATRYMEAARALGRGEAGEATADQILWFVCRKTCNGSKERTCNHLGCIRAERLQEWIREEIGTKAA